MEIKQLLDALKNILKNAEKLDNKDNILVNVPLEDIPTIVDTLEKQVSQEPRLDGDGLQIVGMSYEEFCRQVEDKTEVVFMTGEEVAEMREALKLYRKIREAVVK